VSKADDSKEWCGGWQLDAKDDQRKLSRWAECAVGPNC
jgi:hypothetical protein